MTDGTLSSTTTTTNSASFSSISFWESFVWPLLYRGSGLLLGLIAVVGSLLYYKQDSLLYMPVVAGIPRFNRDNPRGYRSPNEQQRTHFKELRIPCPDGVSIHAWLLLYTDSTTVSSSSTQPPFSQSLEQQQPPPQTRRLPTILVFHGNAGNIGMRLPMAVTLMQQLKFCHVLLVEYRGYGDSDDAPQINEVGLQMDAVAVLEYCRTSPIVQPYVDAQQLILFGQSLGGAVAFFLAHYALQQQQQQLQQHHGIIGIMVENTFTSISDMVDVIFPPFLAPIKHLILRIGWNSASLIAEIVKEGRIPILFLAGAKDQIVPHHHMLKLHQLALQAATAASSSSSSSAQASSATLKQQQDKSGGSLVQMHIIPNGTHNESWYQGGRAYWKAMAKFVQEIQVLRQHHHSATTTTTTAVVGTTTTQKSATTATRSDSTISTASSSASSTSQQQQQPVNIIPTTSTRLLDIAKEAITGHGIAIKPPTSTTTTDAAATCHSETDKKNI